jgi:hypothetical protein
MSLAAAVYLSTSFWLTLLLLVLIYRKLNT